MDKSGVGAVFLRELRFPLPMYIPSASPQSSSLSPETGTIGQEKPQSQKTHKPYKLKKKIRKRLGKHVPATKNTHATTEEFLDVVFLCGPCRTNYSISGERKLGDFSSQNFMFLYCGLLGVCQGFRQTNCLSLTS
jgi:hypothetical protein